MTSGSRPPKCLVSPTMRRRCGKFNPPRAALFSWAGQSPIRAPSVLIPGFVTDTRNVPTIPPGRPWETENAKNTGPDPSAGPTPGPPQPPPPQFPDASRHPPQRVGSDNMIPAPVRSVPQTDRWCLQLLTSMQRDCDTVNPPCGDVFGPRGTLRAGGRADHGTTPVLEHSEPKTQDTRSLLTSLVCLRNGVGRQAGHGKLFLQTDH